MKHLGRVLSLVHHPHAKFLQHLMQERPQHVLLIPALLRNRKLGHALVSDGPIVHLLLESSPTTRVTIVTNQSELWNSSHGRVACASIDSFRGLMANPPPQAKAHLTAWATEHAVDTVVNLADEVNEGLFVGMAPRYASLTGRSVADRLPPSAHRSRLRYTLASGVHPVLNRTAFGDSLIHAVTGTVPEGWRQRLFCDPQDKPSCELLTLVDKRRPLLLINLYGSGNARSWYHLPSAALLIRRLLEDTRATVVLAAPLSDRQQRHQAELLQTLPDTYRARVVTIEDASLRTLKRLILLCDDTITVDSGAAHLAYGLGRSPLVLSQWLATLGHPFGAWHPAPSARARYEATVFSLRPSRFSAERVLARCSERLADRQ